MKESLKKIQGYFHFLILISITALVLLFSPNKNYNSEIQELKTLKEISDKRYKQFIIENLSDDVILAGTTTYNRSKLTERLFSMGLYEVDFNNRNRPFRLNEPYYGYKGIEPIITYYHKIPRNEPLNTWVTWLKSKNNATYLKPDWKTANRGVNLGIGNTNFSGATLRHFSMHNSKYDESNIYRYRAFIDYGNKNLDSADNFEDYDKYYKGAWWFAFNEISSFNNITNHKIFGHKMDSIYDIYKVPIYVIEGTVKGTKEVEAKNSSPSDWIKTTPFWNKIAYDGYGSLSVLPSLQSVWSEVSELNIDNALNYLIVKRNEEKKISLLGFELSYYLAIIAIPLVYFMFMIYLLLHLNNLNKMEFDELIDDHSWIGLYNSKLAKIVIFISILVIPFLLCLGLLIKYGDFSLKGYLVASALFTIANLIVGYLILKENQNLRSKVSS